MLLFTFYFPSRDKAPGHAHVRKASRLATVGHRLFPMPSRHDTRYE